MKSRILATLCALVFTSANSIAGAEPAIEKPKQFDRIYEPSGVLQLPDGKVLIVEDEKERSISILRFGRNQRLSTEPLKHGALPERTIGRPELNNIQDLEGITIDDRGYIYAITSHSPTRSGTGDEDREKLVRFRIEENRIAEPLVATKLKKKIVELHDTLKESAGILEPKRGKEFNIEALEFDRNKEKLLIGFRSPLIDKKAVIAVLENPAAIFEQNEKARFSDQLILLDLDKGGIRAMTFDSKLNGYLIISRREDKKGKKFKLWLWGGNAQHAPRRARLDASINLDYAEGISPVRLNEADKILVVFDDGNAIKMKGAHYLVLDYEQLEID